MAINTFERARSVSAKQEREEAILGSAAELALRHGIRNVTLTDIATGVGMHKSTMLRYFETREEIFLRLATRGWIEWSAAVTVQLDGIEVGEGIGCTPQEAAAILASTLIAQPLFCELLAHIPLNLERGVSLPVVKEFKLIAIDAAARVATGLRGLLPLDSVQAGNVVATATAMTGALWQMAAPGTALRSLYDSDPELAHARIDVEPRLANILEGLLAGYCRR